MAGEKKDEDSLEELRNLYEQKTGKKVPNNKKNDKEWIEEKIAE